MKRYLKFFNKIDIESNLNEAVINVENYSEDLKRLFNEAKKELFSLSKEKNALTITWLFNNYFKKYKIKFKLHFRHELQKHKDYRFGITKAETLLDNYSTIRILCNLNIVEIQKNEKTYDEFAKICLSYIEHELIHRLQVIDISDLKIKKALSSNRKKDLDYFSNAQEIMSYAWNSLEELRFAGNTDKEILKKLKTLNFSTDSLILFNYLKIFDKDSDVLKRFYKYIYMYLNGDFSGKEL